jgi:hypothetical protein
MAWPPSDIPTDQADAGTDNPQVWRAAALALTQAFNMLRNHFSAWARGFVEAADAPAARTALGASTVGSNVFTAADAAAARTALGASAVGGNVFAAADATAARAALGASTVGGNVFTAADQASARSAMQIVSGTYNVAPPFTQNLSAVGNGVGSWVRIGNIVKMSIRFTCTPTTANTNTTASFQLPVPSNFTDESDGSGTGVTSATVPAPARVVASSSLDEMVVTFNPPTTAAINVVFTCQYLVK